MHRALNCGIGMVICVAQDQASRLANLRASGEQPWVIGQINAPAEAPARVAEQPQGALMAQPAMWWC